MLGLFWFLMWQIAGVFLSLRLFPSLKCLDKLTLGSVFGSVLAIWSPIPFSFVFGFSLLSHLIAALIGLSLLLILKPRLTGNICEDITSDWKTHRSFLLFLLFPFLALCVYLLLTHTLRQIGGALYTPDRRRALYRAMYLWGHGDAPWVYHLDRAAGHLPS